MQLLMEFLYFTILYSKWLVSRKMDTWQSVFKNKFRCFQLWGSLTEVTFVWPSNAFNSEKNLVILI